MKLLLIVTVLGIGGPHGRPPARLDNATIAVRRVAPSTPTASSTTGSLSTRLGPGLYTIVAMVNEAGAHPRFCEATAVAVARSGPVRTRRVAMYCTLK